MSNIVRDLFAVSLRLLWILSARHSVFQYPAPVEFIELHTGRMEGKELVRLMWRERVTIRELARRMQITQKRIREVRGTGLVGRELIRDWIQGIICRDPLEGYQEWEGRE